MRTAVRGQLALALEPVATGARARRATAPTFSAWLMAQPANFDRHISDDMWVVFVKREYVRFCDRAGLEPHPGTAPWSARR